MLHLIKSPKEETSPQSQPRRIGRVIKGLWGGLEKENLDTRGGGGGKWD